MAHYFNDSRVPLGIKIKAGNLRPSSNRFITPSRVLDDGTWSSKPTKTSRVHSANASKSRYSVSSTSEKPLKNGMKLTNSQSKVVIPSKNGLDCGIKESHDSVLLNEVNPFSSKLKSARTNSIVSADTEKDLKKKAEPDDIKNLQENSVVTENTTNPFLDFSLQEPTTRQKTSAVYQSAELDGDDQSFKNKNEKKPEMVESVEVNAPETLDSEVCSNEAKKGKILVDPRSRRIPLQPRKSCLKLSKHPHKKDPIDACSCSKAFRRSDPQIDVNQSCKCCMHGCLGCMSSEPDCRIRLDGPYRTATGKTQHQVQFEKVVVINAAEDSTETAAAPSISKEDAGFAYQISLGAPRAKRQRAEENDASDFVGGDSPRLNNSYGEDKTTKTGLEAAAAAAATAATAAAEIVKKSSLPAELSSCDRNLSGKKQLDNRLLKSLIIVALSIAGTALVILGPAIYDYLFYEEEEVEEEADFYEDMSYPEIALDYVLASFQEAFGGVFRFLGRVFFQPRACKRCSVAGHQ